MSGIIQRPVHFRKALLWALLLGLCLPLTGQINITRYDYLNKKGKKETNQDKDFPIFLAVTDINGNNGQTFQKSKGNVFDFGGSEKGLVDITINFPQSDDYQLILRKKCLRSSDNLSLSGPYSLKGKDNEFSAEQKIQYHALKNGEFEIKVNYYILHKDLDPLLFTCEDAPNSITFTGEIKGIATKEEAVVEEVKAPPVVCADVIANNRDNCERLTEMIRTNSACSFEAVQALRTHKEALYKQCFDGKSAVACEAFLACDSKDSRVGAVTNRLKELAASGVPEEESPDRNQWKSIEKSADYKNFLDFYYQNPKSAYRARALDSLSKYYPWTFSLVEKQGDRRIYRIDSVKFVKSLRWKDVSILPGLGIDASNLLLDGTVAVSARELGDYKLYFQDGYGRRDSIAFSTQLKGILKQDDKKYTVHFEGGTPPYQIELVDIGQNKTVKTYPSVQTDSFVISEADIKSLDLPHLKVWIQDAASIRVSAEGDILSKSPLDFQRIAAFALIVLLTLLVVYLLVIFVRRRRRKAVQFQEA